MPDTILLDHLTLPEAGPGELLAIASATGYGGVGLFLHSMPEVPGMQDFDLLASPVARREIRQRAVDTGISVAAAYPFNLTRTDQSDTHLRSLDAAHDVGAQIINLLVFDRDLTRRAETLGNLAVEAASRGLSIGIEFFPLSAVPSLDDAVALCEGGGTANVGLTVDLLHLHRSGGSAAALAKHQHLILLAQFCDAPTRPPADPFYEAAAARLRLGKGELDIAAFLDAGGAHVRKSIEIPCEALRHVPPMDRARLMIEDWRSFMQDIESH